MNDTKPSFLAPERSESGHKPFSHARQGKLTLKDFFSGWMDAVNFHRERLGVRTSSVVSYWKKAALPAQILFYSWGTLGAIHLANIEDAMPNIRLLVGAYSTLFAVAFFAYEGNRLHDCMQQFQRVAAAIEIDAVNGSEEEEDLSRAATSGGRWRFWMSFYGLWAGFSSAIPSLVTRKPGVDLYPNPTSELGVWAAIVLGLYAICMSAINYFPYWGLIIGTSQACSSMYRCLARRLKTARGPAEYRKIALLHSQLSHAWTEFRALVAPSLAHTISGTLTTPCLMTFSLVHNIAFDVFCLAILPIIVIVFIPVCEAGEGLTKANELVCLQAYDGAWLDEDPYTRRSCRLVILMSQHQGTLFAKPLGEVNRRACFICLKSWFSYVHALINLKH